MDEILIIDAYNIIHNWPDLRKFLDISPEASRIKLEEIMINYAAFTGHQVMIIYDGQVPLNRSLHYRPHPGLDVYFSQEETADILIERMVFNRLKQMGEGGQIFVATSDALEQSMIFSQGAYRMTPRELWQKIEKTRRLMQEKAVSEQHSWRIHTSLDNHVFAALEKIRRSD